MEKYREERSQSQRQVIKVGDFDFKERKLWHFGNAISNRSSETLNQNSDKVIDTIPDPQI